MNPDRLLAHPVKVREQSRGPPAQNLPEQVPTGLLADPATAELPRDRPHERRGGLEQKLGDQVRLLTLAWREVGVCVLGSENRAERDVNLHHVVAICWLVH